MKTMKNKLCLVFVIVILIAACTIGLFQHNKQEGNWVHKSFQGIVTNLWTNQDNTFFTIIPAGSNSEKSFIVDDGTIYVIDFQIGDEVIVESDYNTNEHNGDDVPYPAIMITDPSITDME